MRNSRCRQTTVQDEIGQRQKYADEDRVRPFGQMESLQYQLAALRETNRNLSRDLTDQGG